MKVSETEIKQMRARLMTTLTDPEDKTPADKIKVLWEKYHEMISDQEPENVVDVPDLTEDDVEDAPVFH